MKTSVTPKGRRSSCNDCNRELTVYLTYISNYLKVNCAGSGKNICKKAHVRFLPTIRVFRDAKPLGDYTDDRTMGRKPLT